MVVMAVDLIIFLDAASLGKLLLGGDASIE
jgi:hypothetical protein